MKHLMAYLALILGIALAVGCGDNSTDETADSAAQPDIRQLLVEATKGEHRSEANRARDEYRNPLETLEFFGLEPDMTVVEVWPGGGWYTEILAPVLRQSGKLVAANFPDDAESAYRARIGREFLEKLEQQAGIYDRVEVVNFDPPGYSRLGESESADMVLLSRHFHNFIRGDVTAAVLDASYDVLRPGGILAVVQHRAPPDAVPESEKRTGYVRESYVIEKAQAAGFRLDKSSDINANPRDPRAHPAGVWSLPPSLRHCEQIDDEKEREACEAKYLAIGESDRMTLRFVKPD